MTLPQHPIVTDKNFVSLKGFKDFHTFSNLSGFKQPYTFIRQYGVSLPEGSAKGKNRFVASLFGPMVHKNLPAAMYNTFIKENFVREEYMHISHSGRDWKVFCVNSVREGVKNLEKVKEVRKDGLFNLTPFAIEYGKTPSECKKFFGKAIWKKLASNSPSRNKLLTGFKEDTLAEHPWLLDVRSGILLQVSTLDLSTVEIAARISPTVREYLHTLNIVRDTKYMLEQLGSQANPNWSYSRWQEEHDKATKALNAKRFSKEPFTDPFTATQDGYTFTRLCSPFEVAQEGSEMRHCVGSYSGLCQEGYYEVYKVEGNGERATLGVDVNEDATLSYNQLYGRYNSCVSGNMNLATYNFIGEESKSEDSVGRRIGRLSRRGHQDTRPVLYGDF